jgi:hypothetical protein
MHLSLFSKVFPMNIIIAAIFIKSVEGIIIWLLHSCSMKRLETKAHL